MEHIIAKLLRDFEQGHMTRRQLIQSLALTATAASAVSPAPAAAADGKVFKALSINHVSYQVADYTKTRDFYAGLFGMQVSRDDGMQCRLSFGDNILIARNRPSGTPKVESHRVHARQLGHGQQSQASGRSRAQAPRVGDPGDARQSPRQGPGRLRSPDGREGTIR